MNVTQAVKSRHSVRGFKPEPVPDALLENILDVARHAPSNCNIQPWHLAVVSGEAKAKLSLLITQAIDSGAQPSPFFPPGDLGLEGIFKERQYGCAMRYFSTLGISREDRERREQQGRLNWQFYNAPHVAFLSMPQHMGVANALDLGIYLQTLILLFVEHGLARCPQGALALYPEPVFQVADVPAGNAIVCGISFGYEDTGDIVNNATMDRAPLSETVSFTR